MNLEVKSNECSTLESKILELNKKMSKLQKDHCVTITQLNQSLKDTEDLKCSLESIIDQMKIEMNQKSTQNVLI